MEEKLSLKEIKEKCGAKLKKDRLLKNLKHGDVAKESGIAPSTLHLVEKGIFSNPASFIAARATVDRMEPREKVRSLSYKNYVRNLKLNKFRRNSE